MRASEQALILQRLKELSQDSDELERYMRVTLAAYLRDQPHRRQVERMTQMVIEGAIDTSDLLIKAMQQPPPTHSSESFERLRDLKAVGRSLAARFEKYVRLRNDLVHRYRETKDEAIWHSAKELVRDARFYIRNVQQYVASQEE